ncbi:hypothetical protein Tco_0420548 [Tanacetum coccineum]
MLQLSNHWHYARNVHKEENMMERRKETHFINSQEAGKSKRGSDGLADKWIMGLSLGRTLLKLKKRQSCIYGIGSSNECRSEAQILAYSQAVKKLEAQLVTFQKQQLSLNKKLTFQANEIYEKDEKLKRYRRIGMKVVKEKEQLQKTLDTWKDSSKNLWRLINSGMSSKI